MPSCRHSIKKSLHCEMRHHAPDAPLPTIRDSNFGLLSSNAGTLKRATIKRQRARALERGPSTQQAVQC